MRLLWAIFAISSAFTAGCASLAKQPDTPADDIPLDAYVNVPTPPGERYFLLVFGSESKPKKAKYTHTWATMVRVKESPGTAPTLEQFTISWMPATLDIQPYSRRVEPGVNLDMRFSVEEMLRHDETVAVWGPYEVGFWMFDRFMVQKQFIDSGKIGYQCIDSIGEAARKGNGCDCIHAVTDLDPLFDRSRYPLSYYGLSGSKNVVRQIHTRPVILHPEADHSRLFTQLGLDEYPIERRPWKGRTVEGTPENVERYMKSLGVRLSLLAAKVKQARSSVLGF
jgi:hypothetical protein